MRLRSKALAILFVLITLIGANDAWHTTGDDWDWDDRERGRKVYDYYGTPWTVL